MNKKKFLNISFFLLSIAASFLLGIYFKELKYSILKLFKTDSDKQPVVQEEILNFPKYTVEELGNTSFKDAYLINMIFNGDNKDYMRDITFSFEINNKTLQEGIKTVALIGCEYTYNGKEMSYIEGTGIGRILDKAILLNKSGVVTVGSTQFISYGICTYDSNGNRGCVKNNDNVITINSCVLGYSSNPDETHIGSIAWSIGQTINGTNYSNFTYTDTHSEIDINTDILEKISINKSITISREGKNQ